MSPHERNTRLRLLKLVQDLIGEEAEQFHLTEGRLCSDCPVLNDLFAKIRNAVLLEEEKMTEEERERYGLG